MFDRASYIGYTLLFCLPPIVLLWLRAEFCAVLARRWRTIAGAVALLTAYGCAIWPVALRVGAWSYDPGKISGVRVLGYVYLDDVLWWALVSFLLASFVVLSVEYERRGEDIVLREIGGLVRAFGHAVRGLRVVPRERNATIHVAVSVLVLLEALLFELERWEWAAVWLAIGLVIGLELANSAVERLAARTGPPDPAVGLIKDAAAGAVLVAAVCTALLGLLIFLPRLLRAVSATAAASLLSAR